MADKKPDVVAVTNIHHGYPNDKGENEVTVYAVGDKLPADRFSDKELQDLISCQAAVDTAGVLQQLVAVPFVDEQTAKRDALLAKAGMPILVDTSNPLNRGIPDAQISQAKTLEEENERLKEELEAMRASKASSEDAQTVSKTPITTKK